MWSSAPPRACAACGSTPLVRRVGAVWQVSCDEWGCPERACSVGATEQQARERWDAWQAGERPANDYVTRTKRADWNAR